MPADPSPQQGGMPKLVAAARGPYHPRSEVTTAAGLFPGIGEESGNAVAHRPHNLDGVADDLLLKVTPPRVPRTTNIA